MVHLEDIVLVLSIAACLFGLAITYWLHSRLDLETKTPVSPPPPVHQSPLISVIVPARNEARNIRRCVEALLGQTYPNLEIIVVDDRSTDGTSELLAGIQPESQDGHQPEDPVEVRTRNSKLVVVPGVDLPPGWAGKPHALVQGTAAAQGDWLCFLDADTFAAPELIASTHAAATRHNADCYTILTGQELGGFWEKVILPLVFMGLAFGFPADKVNDPEAPEAIANGQYILVRREVYEAVGGHRAIKDRIDEDKAFAEAVKGTGYRLVLADGRDLAKTRMYTSLAEMWEGWTKNIYLGLRDRLGLLTFGAAMALLGALALPLWLLGGIVWVLVGGGIPAVAVAVEALLVWGYLICQRIQAARAFEISPGYAFTLPLGAAIFAAMMFASAYKVLSGRGVTWKGRRYRGNG